MSEQIDHHAAQLALVTERLKEPRKTLRDEFAMAALVLAWTWPLHDIADRAYEIADAMMKVRAKVLDEDTSPHLS